MKRGGVLIDDTFAEAFPMKATRLLVTAIDEYWAWQAANAMTGFASSVIGCGVEAGIERALPARETPDGRPGYAVLMFAMSRKALTDQVQKRVGQSVMTTATSACFAGLHSDRAIPMGQALRYFGDGRQIAKLLDGVRYWRIPVMHGEFICEESTGLVEGVGGGNVLLLGADAASLLPACRAAVEAIGRVEGVVTTFPGGVVGSGSKVGSKYGFLPASTNERYCPTLKGAIADSALDARTGAVMEIVMDGLSQEAVRAATRAAVEAACRFGPKQGVHRISAGNYGGKLGPYHFHLREIMA